MVRFVNDIVAFSKFSPKDPRHKLFASDIIYTLKQEDNLKNYREFLTSKILEEGTLNVYDNIYKSFLLNDDKIDEHFNEEEILKAVAGCEYFITFCDNNKDFVVDKDSVVFVTAIDRLLLDSENFFKAGNSEFYECFDLLSTIFVSSRFIKLNNGSSLNLKPRFIGLIDDLLKRDSAVFNCSKFANKTYPSLIIKDRKLIDMYGKLEELKLRMLRDYLREYKVSGVIDKSFQFSELLSKSDFSKKVKEALDRDKECFVFSLTNEQLDYKPILNVLNFKERFYDLFLLMDEKKSIKKAIEFANAFLKNACELERSG